MRRLRFTLVIVVTVLFSVQKQVRGSVDDGSNTVGLARALDMATWGKRSPRFASTLNTALECEKPQIYICEDTPNPIAPEVRKSCNYRSQRYHEQVYRWVAGRGCLLYTPDFLYVGGVNPLNLNAGCFYGSWFAPCLELPKEDGSCGCYPFDPGLEEVASAVNAAILPAAHGRWERCFYAAAECCSHYMLGDTNYSDPNQCEATFDGWTCWQAAEVDTVATEVCSEFAYSGQGPSCNHFSSKPCYANGSWEIQTDYSTCSITPRLLRRYRFYIAVLSFSIVACLPAVFLFFYYKRLRNNTRVALHRNLLIAIIFRNVLVIVSRSEIYIDELTNVGVTVMVTHSIACRVLAFFERAAANAVFVCMLVEGIYLHRLIVAVFRRKLNIKLLYGAGAVMTVAPAVAWAVVMALLDDHSCWLVYTVAHVQWILDGPRVAILLVNCVLFVDVLRVLLTQVRNSENANNLNTTKATLFLIPIFGVQFLLTAFRPSTDNCTTEQIYYYISYSVESLQGFIVAMLYCYVNKEVHNLVKATYRKAENAVVSRVRRDSSFPSISTAGKNERKMTLSTAVSSTPDVTKSSATPLGTKLHVAEIISIQASERLAEILEPEYETIGCAHENYDTFERMDDGSESRTPDKPQYYYGFTNASSETMECQDWIHTTPSSTYNSSLTDVDAKDLEAFDQLRQMYLQRLASDPEMKESPNYKNVLINDTPFSDSQFFQGRTSAEREDMLDEIMQYMENCDMSKNIMQLDPSLFFRNRASEKIVFVDDINNIAEDIIMDNKDGKLPPEPPLYADLG